MRPAPRLYTPARLGSGSYALSQDEARYLGSVLRLRAGDSVRLFSSTSGEWLYVLDAVEKRSGSAHPVEQLRAPATEHSAPALLFAPVKRTQTEFLVQKATELGAAKLQPVITARTNRENLRLDRLEAIAREAAEQCERLSLPVIAEPQPLVSALETAQSFLFCDEAGDDEALPWGGDLGRAPAGMPSSDNVPEAILIGPEGGFTPEERNALRADPRAIPISLGPRILRAETAAIVALTLWQAHFGDLR